MLTENLKELIRQRKGIPVGKQDLRINGQQLEEGRSLSDYGISHPSTVHLVLHLRGGTDQLTGGRQHFKSLSPKSAAAVRSLLQFQVRKPEHHRHLTAGQWQEMLLEVQSFLFSINQALPVIYTPDKVMAASSLLFLSLNDDQHSELSDTDSDDDVSSDE